MLSKSLLDFRYFLFIILFFLPQEAFSNKLKSKPFSVSQTRFFETVKDFEKGQFLDTVFSPGKGIALVKQSRRFVKSGSFVSPVIKTPFPITELIPSWNIDTPTSTGFAVYFKVGGMESGWTDWFFLGREGITPKINFKSKSQKGVSVDVDYLLLEKPFSYYQWRADLFTKAPARSPHLKLLSVAIGNSRGNKKLHEKFSRKISPENGWIKKLNVPYRSQLAKRPRIKKRTRHSICCPVSVAMVLEYYGVKVSTKKICDLCFCPDYKIWGVWLRAAQTLSRFGLRSYVTQLRSVDELKPFISKDIPVIISIKARKGEIPSAPYNQARGHLLVVIGFDTDENVWVNDPYNTDGKKGPRKWTKKELETVFVSRGGIAIIAEPHK